MFKRELSYILFILFISYILLSANIGGLDIYALDEAKNSECAREMLEKGDLIVPTFNYELRTDKPPLHYYFMIAAYSVIGVNEFSARFFSVIFGVFTVFITFLFTRKYTDRNTALITTMTLLSSLHFSIQFHMAVPDPYLIFFITASFFAFYTYLKTDKLIYLISLYVSLGLGTLTKGPVALALPGLTFLVYLLVTRKFNWKTIKSFHLEWGIPLFLLVVLPWYIAVHLKTGGEWTDQFFFKHNLNRYTGTMEGHGAIFLVTPLMVIIGMLPFSIFFIQAFRHSWKYKTSNDVFLYAAIGVTAIIVFFSMSSTKLPNYTVPAYPLLAIMLGGFLSNSLIDVKLKKGSKISLIVYSLISVALPFALYVTIANDTYFSHLKFQSGWFVLISFGAIIGTLYMFRGKQLIGFYIMGISWMVVILVFFFRIFPEFDKENPVTKSLEFIDRSQPIRGYNLFNPSYVFYLQQEIPKLHTPEELMEFCENNPGGQIITRTQYEKDYMGIENLEEVTRNKDIFEIPTSVILRVKE